MQSTASVPTVFVANGDGKAKTMKYKGQEWRERTHRIADELSEQGNHKEARVLYIEVIQDAKREAAQS